MATLCLLALGACGGDDDGGSGNESQRDATESTSTAPSTTETTPTDAAPSATEGDAPFSDTYVFSGDEVQKCIEGEGLTAPREDEPAPEDKVGQGIVHDRLMIGPRGGEPALRLFMFGSADLAKEQGEAVTARTAEAEVLGTTIFEPLAGDAPKETAVALACLKEQAGD